MLEAAKSAAIHAGRKVLLKRPKGLSFTSKERLGDFATDADTESQTIIITELQKRFPRHNFVAEEDSLRVNNHSEYTWVIDPLDGTIPYSSGLPIFGISIGLLKDSKPVLGVVNLPQQNWLFWAEKGKGAFMNGERIRVSGKKELIECVVGFDYAYAGMRQAELTNLISPVVDKVRYPPMLGSAVAASSYVAKGMLDGYIHSAHPWDYAAAAVLVTEAGGKVTDFQGQSIDWSKEWINFFASNSLIHEEILALINK